MDKHYLEYTYLKYFHKLKEVSYVHQLGKGYNFGNNIRYIKMYEKDNLIYRQKEGRIKKIYFTDKGLLLLEYINQIIKIFEEDKK